jgi:serine/threonine protein kinase
MLGVPTPLKSEPKPAPLIDRLRRATDGRFDVLAMLGEGGMATVFLARDLTLDRQVAIKMMHPGLMTSDAAIERFHREARIAASLDHPNIINIFTVGEDPAIAYFVMRYLEGRTLQQLIQQEGAFTTARAMAVVESMGRALHYAHRRGVVHRDVKPANVMVLEHDDWVVVTDFGIAKLDADEHLTVSGHVVGTPNYMCPEYFDRGEVSAKSDQYALGVVAFELFTGTLPFNGRTVGELMRGHLFDAVPAMSSVRGDLPPVLDEVVSRMLAKNPDARYADVSDAVSAMRAALATGTSGEVATEIIRTPESWRVTSGALWRRTVRVRRAVMTMGVVAVASAAATAAFVMNNDDPSSLPTVATDAARGSFAPPTATPPSEDLRTPPPATRTPASLSEPIATAPPPQPVATTGSIRIGSRLPLATLYVNDRLPMLIGEQGIVTVAAPTGATRVRVRLDGCADWDTTITVRGGATHTIGYRAPRC